MKQIEEIYWLRFYGCLAVFTFHLIDRIERNYLEHVVLDLAYIPTVVGTPIFIFISIFLFSARYGENIPHHFLARRFKYMMVPYVVYGLIYSMAEYVRLWLSDEPVALLPHLVEYLLFAGWHGYFLVVAMQFYILFWCYNQFRAWRWLPPGPCLIVASFISIGWWGFFRWQSIEPPGYLHWVAPVGWLYLFFLALLLVRHYPDLESQRWFRFVTRPIWLIGVLAGILFFSLQGQLEYSSKETWVVPLFILALLWSLPRLADRKATALVKRVNQASFGIYLAHPLFFSVVDFVTWHVSIPLWLYVISMVVVGITGSLLLNNLANRAEWSAVMFGKQLRLKH
ncbi:acyltransferase [Marinobacter sp. HL-58]|uniref:acyltransferase family protein n=1 Tax=Marinobacter sp. HL-58 TaxID=1479237 RepID=UPI0004885E5F|nr:acyltransferase [Marinobacter sp. HL-58]KPQ01598.1 MAG: Acyltransferase family [Marinobacter sp. HL-58]